MGVKYQGITSVRPKENIFTTLDGYNTCIYDMTWTHYLHRYKDLIFNIALQVLALNLGIVTLERIKDNLSSAYTLQYSNTWTSSSKQSQIKFS